MQIDWIGNMGIVLFKNKKTCCGCGACASICPKEAISMKPDNQGFIYPVFHVVHVKRYVHIRMKVHCINRFKLMRL